jgi:hypothetical protein
MQIEPTEQERQLLSILREWGEKDHYRLVIEFNDGAWEIEITAHRMDTRRRAASAQVSPLPGTKWLPRGCDGLTLVER